MSGKITKQEDEIISQIQKQIIEGHNRKDIIEFVEKEFKQKNALLLYNKALDDFGDYSNTPSDIKHGFAMAATQELYKKMMGIADFAGALSAIKEFAKLNDLYNISKKKKGGVFEDIEPPGESSIKLKNMKVTTENK